MPSVIPDVSLILPIYNAGKYLAPCLDSIINQTLASIEIICVNDGSTDDSLAVMQSYAKKDARINIIDKKNGGYGCANNIGIRAAKGVYIAIIEPDDYIDLHMCEELVAYAKSFNPLPDTVKSSYWRVCFADSPEQRIVHGSFYKRIKPAKQPFKLEDCPELIRHHPSIWSALYRRDFLEQNNISFREFPGAGWADNPFLLDTLLRAQSIVYMDKPYYYYREDLPGSSSVLKKFDLPFDRWNDMMDILEELQISDEGILSAHYCRGFTYFNGVLEGSEGLENPEIDRRTREMFARMDPALVMSEKKLSPSNKALFCEMRGLAAQDLHKGSYYCSLIEEFFYTARVNGLGFAFARISHFFDQRKARSNSDYTLE